MSSMFVMLLESLLTVRFGAQNARNDIADEPLSLARAYIYKYTCAREPSAVERFYYFKALKPL